MTAHKHLCELKPLCDWKIACKGSSNILGEAGEFWWDLAKTAMKVPNQGVKRRSEQTDKTGIGKLGTVLEFPMLKNSEQQTLLLCTKLPSVFDSFP